MPKLRAMPPITISPAQLAPFGRTWAQNGQRLSRTPPNSSGDLGRLLEAIVGDSLATMLGSIPVVRETSDTLIPRQRDCVETGQVLIVGGVRPQNFDVVYRPDGVRFAFDVKTLNDRDSVSKNWQNMLNDLSTEATTVHSRFPHAVAAFMVVIPSPCLLTSEGEATTQQAAMIETLERLARRREVNDPVYLAEAVAFVVWNPADGAIRRDIPDPTSPLHVDNFAQQVEAAYVTRYKGLPPHTA